MRFPSIAAIASELRRINSYAFVAGDGDGELIGCDVRLQVYADGGWAVRYGSPDYDLDHRGSWGSSSVPGAGKRFNARDVARDLIAQAREMHADSE
jgi:hypothetical protein